MSKFKYERMPPTDTKHLRGFLAPADAQERDAATHALYDYCGKMVEAITKTVLWPRFRQRLGPDVVQEAWADCMGELLNQREEFLRDRAERPQFRPFVVAVTMRAVWRLQKQAQREDARSVEVDDQVEALAIDEAVSRLGVMDFHVIFSKTWTTLLEASSPEEQQVLSDVGPVAFFANDWHALSQQPVDGDAPRTMTTTVLELRLRVQEIAEQILKREYKLDKQTRRRFLDALLSVHPRPGT